MAECVSGIAISQCLKEEDELAQARKIIEGRELDWVTFDDDGDCQIGTHKLGPFATAALLAMHFGRRFEGFYSCISYQGYGHFIVDCNGDVHLFDAEGDLLARHDEIEEGEEDHLSFDEIGELLDQDVAAFLSSGNVADVKNGNYSHIPASEVLEVYY